MTKLVLSHGNIRNIFFLIIFPICLLNSLIRIILDNCPTLSKITFTTTQREAENRTKFKEIVHKVLSTFRGHGLQQ